MGNKYQRSDVLISRLLLFIVTLGILVLFAKRLIWVNQSSEFSTHEWKTADPKSIWNTRYMMWEDDEQLVIDKITNKKETIANLGEPDTRTSSGSFVYQLGNPRTLIPWGVDWMTLEIFYDDNGNYQKHRIVE